MLHSIFSIVYHTFFNNFYFLFVFFLYMEDLCYKDDALIDVHNRERVENAKIIKKSINTRNLEMEFNLFLKKINETDIYHKNFIVLIQNINIFIRDEKKFIDDNKDLLMQILILFMDKLSPEYIAKNELENNICVLNVFTILMYCK